MMYRNLAFGLSLFCTMAHAMETDIIWSDLVKEYVLDDEDYYHKESSLEECKKTYGNESATVNDQRAIRTDLALFNLNDPSIELYKAEKWQAPLVLVDYKKDNPIIAFWSHRRKGKATQDFAYLNMFAFVTLVKKKRFSPTFQIIDRELGMKCVRRSFKALLDHDDKRGTDYLKKNIDQVIQRQDTAELFQLLVSFLGYNKNPASIRWPMTLVQEAITQRQEVHNLPLPQKQKLRRLHDILKMTLTHLLHYIVHQRRMHNDLKRSLCSTQESVALSLRLTTEESA